MVCLQNKGHTLVSVANWGCRLLRPTKTVIDRCVNVPARDAPGRNGRSWGSHMNPPLNSCINVGLSGRWAHDAHVRFFRTCRMRLADAVGDLLTSWGRIQVCVCVCSAAMFCHSWSDFSTALHQESLQEALSVLALDFADPDLHRRPKAGFNSWAHVFGNSPQIIEKDGSDVAASCFSLVNVWSSHFSPRSFHVGQNDQNDAKKKQSQRPQSHNMSEKKTFFFLNIATDKYLEHRLEKNKNRHSGDVLSMGSEKSS